MTLPIVTPRLVIRAYTLDDLDDVAAVFADPAVAEAGKAPMDRDESRAWLAEEIAYERRDGTGRYALVLRVSDRVIGGCGLVQRMAGRDYLDEAARDALGAERALELGYHLRSDVWGRGLGTEAALACLAEARERGLRRLVAFIEPGNERSGRLAARIGMKAEGLVTWFGRPHLRWTVDPLAAPARPVDAASLHNGPP